MLEKYENKVIHYTCTICGQAIQQPIAPNYEPKFQNEFNSYENIKIECPLCEAQGRNTTHILNINIPEHAEMEENLNMDKTEQHNREIIRKIIWDIRPDLKGMDREKERENYVNKASNQY